MGVALALTIGYTQTESEAPMTQHHPADGCTGQPRELVQEDHDAIAEAMGDMMLHIARKDFPAVMRAGAFVGVHYGPPGEWALALRLATQIVGLAPLDHCDSEGVPILREALSDKSERVRLMTVHCLALFPEMRDHTLEEVDQAIAAAVPLVTAMVAAYKHDRKDECYAAWESMYEVTLVDKTPDRATTLRGAACSALLSCWAARYSAIRLPL